MKFRYWRVTVLAVVMVLLAPMAVMAADQTVDLQVLESGILGIDVEHEVGFAAVEAGVTTDESGFHMNVTNTQDPAAGWEVTVTATDFLSFDWDCNEWGDCERRVHVSPDLDTIGASAIYMKGGNADHWGDPTAITTFEGALAGAGVGFDLLAGTNVAYGSFGIDDPQPSVKVVVPTGAAHNQYFSTLTYTIIAP